MKDLIEAITKLLPPPLSLGLLTTGIAYVALHYILDHTSYGDTARAPQFQTCAVVILAVSLLAVIWKAPASTSSTPPHILVAQFRKDVNDTYRSLFISELSAYIQSQLGQTPIVIPIRAIIRDEESALDNLKERRARMIVYDASVNHVENEHYLCLKLLTADNTIMSSPPPIRHSEIRTAMGSFAEALKECLGLTSAGDGSHRALDRLAGIEQRLHALETAISGPSTSLPRSYRKRYAILIGIDRMQKFDHKLRFSASDARAMAAVLRDRFGYECNVLVDEMATMAGISSAVNELKSTVSTNDAVIVYFAGMGIAIPDPNVQEGTTAVLCPYDFDDSTQIRTDSLIQQVQSLTAAARLLILDVCQSVAGIAESRMVTWNDDSRALVVLGASAATEYSSEGPKGGVFTSALIEELSKLNGASGDYVSANELVSQISRTLVSTSYRQTPTVIRTSKTADFWFGGGGGATHDLIQ